MDELGFRSTSSDMLSVSYTPVVSSSASRKTAASRSNASLSQSSRLSSPRMPPSGSSSSSLSSRLSGKGSVLPTPASSNASIPRFRSLRNMLPFGSKQSNNNSGSTVSLSRKPTNPPVSVPETKPSDLKHCRSSSSIPSSPMVNAGVPKQSFLSVGRRTSLHLSKEKTLPALPPMHRSRSEDLGSQQSPVMSIAPPSASTSKLDVTRHGLPLPDDPFRKAPPNVISKASRPGPSREDFGTVRSGGELSTILESELSNLSISHNSPPLKALKEEFHKKQRKNEEKEPVDDESDSPMLAQLAQEDNNNLSIMHGQDMDVTTATADLSASWEAGAADFCRALNLRVPDAKPEGHLSPSPSSYSISPVTSSSPLQGPSPPTSVPLTSKSEEQLSPAEVEQEGEQVSFNLSALDPDLAALLSPVNLHARLDDGVSAAIAAAVDSMPPPMHSSPSPSPEPEEPTKRMSADAENLWPSAASSRRASVDSRRRTVGLQSSPVRRSRPSSLALSSDSLPLADRARRRSLERTPMNNNIRQPLLSPTPRPDLATPRASVEDVTETAPRPILGHSLSALSRTLTSADTTKPRAPVTRLYATPSRPSTAGTGQIGRVSSDSGRPFLRSSQVRDEHTLDLYTPGSHLRSATSLGVPSRTWRALDTDSVERPATSLSAVGRGGPLLPQRSRKRSLSATTDSRVQVRNIPDWMGPRTARAFAAAGLLDTDTNQARGRDAPLPVPPRAESRMRMTASRASTEREYRLNTGPPSGSAGTSSAPSLYAPSRAGYSEHDYLSSGTGRRTASRTMTMAELASARGESPVTATTISSNTRTAFSSSTATSLSCSSPHQQYQAAHLESAISALKEKHASEMEALLSALADSQRTSKMMRDENIQLRGRMRDLEEQLADVVEQLENTRHYAAQPPIPNSFGRTLMSHQRPSSRASPSKRLHALMQPSAASLVDDDSADAQDTARDPGALLSSGFAALHTREHRSRTRASTTSSIFPVMPSNMSMLLHDDGSDANPSGGFALLQSNTYASSAGSPPASPTLNVNKLAASSAPTEKNRHATKLSLSSIEMSMLSSLPGSPKSLQLRPEHEKHLCDLTSADFSAMDSD